VTEFANNGNKITCGEFFTVILLHFLIADLMGYNIVILLFNISGLIVRTSFSCHALKNCRRYITHC